ncbi:MAG: hypothetical protein FWC78_06245 [Defluviitaleaceae bacterium]|nr:hypothetical protein [Defluviitaleaceae bacterium]
MSAEWLLNNAEPVVRYRTLVELLAIDDEALLQNTMSALLTLPQTQKRLSLLHALDYSKTHGSGMTNLENVLPMLNDFGLYYGMLAFDSEIKNIEDVATIVSNNKYDKLIAYPFLLRSKFPIDGLIDFAVERANKIHEFTQHMDFDIYDDPKNHKTPKAFHGRPIIKPSIAYDAISGEVNIKLPLIYDIVMFAEVYNHVSINTQSKIDNIINYILSPGYDVVVPMYGIIPAPSRRYYAMGWDCKKPFNDRHNYSNQNLHRLLLYSCFPTAVRNTWFTNAINYLLQYKTQSGTFIFPKEYLVEKDCNWVLGTHMSLAENRRKRQWLEVESTFYMLKLLNCTK